MRKFDRVLHDLDLVLERGLDVDHHVADDDRARIARHVDVEHVREASSQGAQSLGADQGNEEPVRSGQSVAFVEGDVTVLGSVGSGAEIIAGGSIHIYGTLRGQAMAGVTGNRRARIFCHRFEAELLAIGSYYKTADEIDDSMRSGPIQAWLDGNALKISAMN